MQYRAISRVGGEWIDNFHDNANGSLDWILIGTEALIALRVNRVAGFTFTTATADRSKTSRKITRSLIN